MFAAEVEMEKKSSSLGPLVMIFALVAVVGGTIFYFVKTAREVLSVPVATTSVNQILKAQGDGKVTFSVGTIVSSVNEKPNDPHYQAAGEGRHSERQAEELQHHHRQPDPCRRETARRDFRRRKGQERRRQRDLHRSVGRARDRQASTRSP